MRRIITLLLVLAAACGGVASDSTDSPDESVAETSTTSQPDVTTTPGEADDPVTTQSPETTRADEEADSATADLPAAPDFTLELGTGGEFTLSSTNNPVYLVFWAEW